MTFDGLEPLVLGTTFALGLRHGVDWDHLSAISDLTGTDLRRRRAAVVAVLYALGHGAAVFALGALAVVAGERLPDWIDPVMDQIVGATLLVLAVAVVRTTWHTGRPVSRGVLVMNGLARARARLRRYKQIVIRHRHAHDHDRRHAHTHAGHDDGHAVLTKHHHDHVHQIAVSGYSVGAALTIGILHGIGAETGTQAVVLAGAAHASAAGAALAVVGAFVLGVVVTTVALALAMASGWAVLGNGRWMRVLTLLAATGSAVVGSLFLLGAADRLPTILG